MLICVISFIITLYLIRLTDIQTSDETRLKFIPREPLLRACTKDINTPCFDVGKYKKTRKPCLHQNTPLARISKPKTHKKVMS